MGPEVLVFMLSVNCHIDFDSDLWSGFDAAMAGEWNINVTTNCYEIKEFPSSLYEYKYLASSILMEKDADSTTVAGRANNFAAYFDALLGQSQTHDEQVVFLTRHSEKVFQKALASGIAYPTENIAFVENNSEYSTGTLSHEILHLVLKEEGHEKRCYVDKVHENQFRYELKEMGRNKHAVMKKFDC